MANRCSCQGCQSYLNKPQINNFFQKMNDGFAVFNRYSVFVVVCTMITFLGDTHIKPSCCVIVTELVFSMIQFKSNLTILYYIGLS